MAAAAMLHRPTDRDRQTAAKVKYIGNVDLLRKQVLKWHFFRPRGKKTRYKELVGLWTWIFPQGALSDLPFLRLSVISKK